MIYDLRLMIWQNSTLRGGSCCVEYLGEFFSFLKQVFKQLSRQKLSSLSQLNPKTALISLFKNNRDLVDKVGIGLRTQHCPIISSHRRATSGDLPTHRFSAVIFGSASTIFRIRTAKSIVLSLSSVVVMDLTFQIKSHRS